MIMVPAIEMRFPWEGNDIFEHMKERILLASTELDSEDDFPLVIILLNETENGTTARVIGLIEASNGILGSTLEQLAPYDAAAVGFTAWIGSDPSTRPSNDPDRKEGVIVYAYDQENGARFAQASIGRIEGEPPVLGAWENHSDDIKEIVGIPKIMQDICESR